MNVDGSGTLRYHINFRQTIGAIIMGYVLLLEAGRKQK